MRMNFLNDALGRVPEYRAIENAVRQRKTPVAVTGLASIHKANILHTLLSAMSKKALFIAGDEAEATRMHREKGRRTRLLYMHNTRRRLS